MKTFLIIIGILFTSTVAIAHEVIYEEWFGAPTQSIRYERNIQPETDSTWELGTTTNAWLYVSSDRFYLNSTAYLDGGTVSAIRTLGNVYPINDKADNIGTDSFRYVIGYFSGSVNIDGDSAVLVLGGGGASGDKGTLGWSEANNALEIKTLAGIFGNTPDIAFTAPTDTEVTFQRQIRPLTDGNVNLGTPSYYWGNAYVNQLYATSSATDYATTTQLTVDTKDVNKYLDFYNGSFIEPFNATTTSDGSVVTLHLGNMANSGNLTMQLSAGDVVLSAPTSTTLTAGSNTSPTENYVYIPYDTQALTVSTSHWPSGTEHIRIAYLLVPSAGFVQTDGVYVNQNWNDMAADNNNQGHMTHMSARSRLLGAVYHSGIDGNGDGSTYIERTAASPDTVYIKSTAGVVYQMHSHTVPAYDTSGSDIFLVVNQHTDNGGAYATGTDLYNFLDDADSDSMSGKYYNLVLWATANKTGQFSPLMINLPTCSYNKLTNAQQDADGCDVFTIPAAFKLESSNGFLIARLTMKHAVGGGGDLELQSTVDLRGATPQSVTGGNAPGALVNFADNQFTIFDEGDVTKIIDFDVGANVSSGNTRTLTIQDADGTLAYVNDQTFTGLTTTANASTTGQVTIRDTLFLSGLIGINGEYFSDLTSTGLLNTAGVLTLNAQLQQIASAGAPTENFFLSGSGENEWELKSPTDARTALGLNLATGNVFVGVGNTPTATSSLYIHTNGYIGIGTTTPYETLSVQGSGVFDGNIRMSYLTATSTAASSTIAGGLEVTGLLEVGVITIPNIDGNNGEVLKTDGAGRLYWAADDDSGGGGGSAFAWTTKTNYDETVNSTSTPIWFKDTIYASSTVKFANGSASPIYGAVVDTAGFGDYTTIEGAFDAGKIVVFVRNGTYNPASDIDIPTGGKLTGESRDGVIIDFEDNARKIAIASGNDDVTVENFTIQNSQPGTTVGAINFVNTDRSVVRNIHFAGGNDQNIEFGGGFANIVTENHFGVTAGANDSTHIIVRSSKTIINDNTATDIRRNFVFVSAAQAVVANNSVDSNSGDFTFAQTSTNGLSIVITGNTVEQMRGASIGDSDALIIGNNFRGNGGGEGVVINNGGERTLVTGNRIYSYVDGVLILSGADNSLIANNWFRGMSGTAISNLSLNTVVQGNYGKDEGERAIDEKKIMWMKNTSGGSLVLGDLVTYKAVAAGDEIASTTTQGDNLIYGMILETISENAYGKVQVAGKTTALKVDGTTDIAIGDFIGTFTTATIGMQAQAGDMAIAIALEAYTTNDSAGVIDALIIAPRAIQ